MARLHVASQMTSPSVVTAPYTARRLGWALWSLAGVTFILWGLRLWGYGTIVPLVAVPSVVLVAWGLALFALSPHLTRQSESLRRWVYTVTLVLLAVALVVWAYSQVVTAPAYGTDEMAFDQYAAHLLLAGVNPYGRSLAAAFSRYQVSPNGYTWTLSGRPVTELSYPAQAFLVYVPFLLMGWHTQVAVGLNVAAWLAGLVILYLRAPATWKPLVVVLGSLSVYISYAVGGVTDALFVPFLVLAAREWDHYPKRRGWAAVWSPLWFGCAMGIKQTPWLIAPFLLVGIAAEGRENGRWRPGILAAARYAAISGAAFLIPNLPFLILQPKDWLHGILLPLIAPTVPDGQGLVTLSLFLHVGGGSLFAFTALSVLVLLGLWVVYAGTYPRLKLWTFLLPSFALFVATRSFGSYLVMLVPATLMSWMTTKSGGRRAWTVRERRLVVGAAVVTAGGLAAALGIPSPLTMTLLSLHTTGQLATVDQVRVAVTNRTRRTLSPHFTADIGGTLTAFWTVLQGPSSLPPHATADYTLAAPNFYAQPAIAGGFEMVAFTARTKTISHTVAYVPNTWHVALTPDAINHPVAYGALITLRAQILNRLDQPVHVSGIPIYLGQIIYAQRGLQYGEAIINGSYPGETPVAATTNADGQATFTIRDLQPETDPVYFEANLVNNLDYYPYGYSQILPIRFMR
ncbi:MAG: hypothetical protein OWU84_04360 [Firmicutes bacterium]|nr:hypothetical protein [Bacillota bacterium]